MVRKKGHKASIASAQKDAKIGDFNTKHPRDAQGRFVSCKKKMV